tara:strand:- start:1058 stop:1900 length:843 start_codon:yes stop_codon:yes gene_type:complete
MKKYKKPLLIAEIGINHNGNLDTAKKLINIAKQSNFDCVKFQKRDNTICIPESQKNIMRETPWGMISYLDYKNKIEFSINQYKQIDKYCKKLKIKWFASNWDTNSQKLMRKFDFPYNKVASAMITNINLLELIASERKKTFISTGMSNLNNIAKAVSIFKKKKCPFVLLHCVSTYPCPEDKLNLNVITSLKKKFKCEVGYSGHESSLSPSIFAWLLGATVIERHITLDRSMWGTDQAASLSFDGMQYLSQVLSKTHVFGDGLKKFTSAEKKISKKFRYWE